MINFALNIGMLFPELDFLHRFEACRAAGFKYVEFPFPYAFAPRLLKEHIEKAGLELILFDLPVDDWAEGGRGCATDPKAVAEFKRGVERALEYAKVLLPKIPHLHSGQQAAWGRACRSVGGLGGQHGSCLRQILSLGH